MPIKDRDEKISGVETFNFGGTASRQDAEESTGYNIVTKEMRKQGRFKEAREVDEAAEKHFHKKWEDNPNRYDDAESAWPPKNQLAGGGMYEPWKTVKAPEFYDDL